MPSQWIVISKKSLGNAKRPNNDATAAFCILKNEDFAKVFLLKKLEGQINVL